MNREIAPVRSADEAGQTMAEYSVVLGVISAAVVAAFVLLSGEIERLMERTVGFFS